MYKKICVSLLALLPVLSMAQQEDSTRIKKEVELGEVLIQSKRMIHHTDRDVYLPSNQQRAHAANVLDLLSLVRLPRIHVDQVEKSISSLSAGEVQLRINGIVASADELQAVVPSRVVKIDYITNPSVRYGNGLSAVIDIKTRRGDNGMSFGVNTMNAMTTNYNDDSGWLLLTHKKSVFGVRYNLKLNSNEDVRTQSTQSLAENDGKAKNISKNGQYDDSKFTSHDLTLSYNTANNSSRVFDVKMSMNWNSFPNMTLIENVTDDDKQYEMSTVNANRQQRPMLKLYYADKIGKSNTLSAYIASAYVDSKYKRGFTTPDASNLYDVAGEKYSIRGELSLTHTFGKYGDIDLGYHQTGAYTRNRYTTGTIYTSAMHDDSQYLFAEYGTKTGKLGLALGIGGSREHFGSAAGQYTFWSFRPEISLKYQLSESLLLSYSYDRESSLPSLAQLTDFTKRENTYEMTVGNSGLKPFNTNYHELKASCDLGDTYFSFIANYDYSRHIICDNPVQFADGAYYYSYGNSGNKRHIELSLYAEQYLFSRKLFIYTMPYFTRDIMKGIYEHVNSCWSVKAGGSAYLGKFTIDFDYSSASERLTGETLTHNCPTTNLSLAYKNKSLSVKLGLRNMFQKSGSGTRTERLSDIAYTNSIIRNHAFGNMVYLSFSWNVNAGKELVRKKVNATNADIDAGIVK